MLIRAHERRHLLLQHSSPNRIQTFELKKKMFFRIEHGNTIYWGILLHRLVQGSDLAILNSF